MSGTADNKGELSEFNDDIIGGLVKRGARVLPNANFENKVMLKIQAEVDYKKEVSTQLRRSLMFFFGAVLTGIVLSVAMLLGKIFGPYDVEVLTILTIFFITAVGILGTDNYNRFLNKYAL